MKNFKLAAAGIALAASVMLSGCSSSVETPDFIHSTVDSNGIYTCELLGIAADLSDAYYIYDDEELADVNGTSDCSDEALAEALSSYGTIYDAMVYLNENGDSFNLTYEDLRASGNSGMSLSDYIDASLDSLESQLESSGMSISNVEKKTVTFAGESRQGISLLNEYGGQTFYQLLIAFQEGDYVASLTFTVTDEAVLDEMLGMFYAL